MFRILNSSLAKVPKSRLGLSQFNTSAARTSKGQPEAKPATESGAVPTTYAEIGPISRYLIYRYSHQKYASLKDVPSKVPISQLYYARDKGRASGMVILLAITIVGSVLAAVYGKSAHKSGVRYTDDIVKQHAEYSKAHQELAKATKE